MVLIMFNYKFYLNLFGVYYLETVAYMCGGTLVDSKTIVTAAHCYIDTLNYGFTQITIEPNEYYPTIESMYSVYLGVHNKDSIGQPASNISISSYKRVKF